MTTAPAPTNSQGTGSELVPAPLSPAVVAAYEAMIDSVPDAGVDGMDPILEAIATATDLDQLDAPWRSGGLDAYIGVPLVILGIRKMPSSFDGGLPWFLVIDAAVTASGEKVTLTTGAVSVVAQLVKAWTMGKFPLAVVPRQSARPSKSGYYPQHLELDRRPSLRGS